MQYEFNKPITTVGELKQYIGKPIYLYYTYGNMGIGKGVDRNKIYYAWIKQLIEISHKYNKLEFDDLSKINKVKLMGLNSLQMISKNQEDIKFIHSDDYKKPSPSDAQEHIRTLTKEEFELYRNKTRNRRYGYIHNT